MKKPLLKLAWGVIPLLLFQPLLTPPALAQTGTASGQQQFTVTGKVTSKSGEALPGVTVVLKGTTIGAATGIDGKYSFSIPENKGTLVFSFIGFAAREVPVNGQTTLNVTLEEETKALGEVVVIGYGTMQKKDLTGAISQVKITQLQNENPRTVQDALRGNVAGLNVGVIANSKGGGDLQVRGKNTINAGSSPLLVVDGVIFYGSLADINPNDIETIDVLKDASSTAVFGAKAASGVVLITTRKGKDGKPVVNLDASLGLATMSVDEQVYGPYEFLAWREALMYGTNANAKPGQFTDPSKLPSGVTLDTWLGYDGPTTGRDPVQVWLNRLNLKPVEIENYKAGTPTDWYDMVFHNGKQQDYNVSLSGKKEDVSYYMSMGYQNNEGIIVGDQYDVVRSRMNLEGKVTKFLTVGLNTQFSQRDESHTPFSNDPRLGTNDPSPTYADWAQIRASTPWGEQYDDNGRLRNSPNDEPGAGGRHPFLSMTYTDRTKDFTTLFSSLFAKVSLPFEITYQLNFTPRYEFYRYNTHRSSLHPDQTALGGTAVRQQIQTYNWQVDNLIKWKKAFGGIHELDVTLLANAEKFQSWENYMENRGFDPNDSLGYHNIGTGSLPNIISDDQYSTGDALMARVFYSLKSRYMLTLSARRDGYSAFGQRNPRATFPAAALGWVFTDESFMKAPALSWLDYGKLRFSWGVNGNRDIGRYEALSLLKTGKYQFQNAAGAVVPITYLYVEGMANPDLKWERTEALNVGLDFGIFKNVVDGSIEAYRTSTTNLLVKRLLSDPTGFPEVWTNLGEVQNKGFELNLTTRNFEREKFSWRTTFNFSLNRNQIVSLYGDKVDVKDASGKVIGQREPDDTKNEWFIGHALDEKWGLRVLGVWQTNEAEEAKRYNLRPGDFKIKDVNNDGKYTNDDKEFLGYTNPRFRWTLRNEFNILKNLDFSFLLYSYWGHINAYNQAKNRDGFPDRGSSYVVPYWTPENPTNEYARLFSNEGGAIYNVYRERSFIRLDNISLAYNLPQHLIARAKMQNARLYFSTRNVGFYAPKWNFWDPENSGPTPRTYTLGVNLTL